MGLKYCMILSIVCILGVLPLFSSVSADDDITVNIYMIGEDERTRFSNSAMVAGIWHYIDITLDDQSIQTINLEFYNGSSIPSIADRDESNYYEWRYTTNAPEWTDLNEYEGYSYINVSNCQKSDSTYSFCVGVKDTLPEITNYYENWTLDIYTDGNEIYTINVVLEKPTVGLSKSHDDVIPFRVEPFIKTDISKTLEEEYFIIGNAGNIPLNIVINYGAYNSILDVAESGNKLSPGDTFNHLITLHSEKWRAGILTITGNAIGTIPDNLIITTAAFTLESSFMIQASNLEISVGYSNYSIKVIPGTNIVFQYEESLEMDEGEIKDIVVFVSGEGTVTLDIWSDEINVEIIKISAKDQTGTPLIIASTNTSEYAVTVRVEAIREGKIGEIYYELEVDGEAQTFTTQITIGPPQQKEDKGFDLNVNLIIVAFLVILVIGYMIFTQIKHRRR